MRDSAAGVLLLPLTAVLSLLLMAQPKPTIAVSGPYSVAGSGVGLDTTELDIGDHAFCELKYLKPLGNFEDANAAHTRTEFIANRFELLDDEVFKGKPGYMHYYCRLTIPRDVREGIYSVQFVDYDTGRHADMGTTGIAGYSGR